MNTFENEIMPAKTTEQRKVADIVRENSESLNECRAIANCIKNFIKCSNATNEKMCVEPCGNGASCLHDELMNQTETIQEIKVLLNGICNTLGC